MRGKFEQAGTLDELQLLLISERQISAVAHS